MGWVLRNVSLWHKCTVIFKVTTGRRSHGPVIALALLSKEALYHMVLQLELRHAVCLLNSDFLSLCYLLSFACYRSTALKYFLQSDTALWRGHPTVERARTYSSLQARQPMLSFAMPQTQNIVQRENYCFASIAISFALCSQLSRIGLTSIDLGKQKKCQLW